MAEGNTVIATAHRLSTIARLDRTLVPDEGRAVASRHDGLLVRDGLSSGLWRRQSSGVLGSGIEEGVA